MKTRSVTTAVVAAILFNSISPAFAGDPDPKKVRELTATIKKKYENIGQNLVLLTFAKVMGERLDFQQIEENRSKSLSLSPTGDSIEGSISEIQNELYPLLFSEVPLEQKENRFKMLFLDLEKGFLSYQNSEFDLYQVRDQILSEFGENETLCTRKSFQETMKFMDANSPALFNFTDLTMDQRFEINLTYSEESGAGANGAYDVDSEGETKAAVTTGLGAAAGLATQIIVTGSAGGPVCTAAAVVAAAVIVTVKLAWDINDVRKHNKVMKELYKANRELFENLNMTEQVEETFLKTCRSLESAYSESRPHVLSILGNISSPEEKQKSLEWLKTEMKALENFGPFDEKSYSASLAKDTENFSRFYKFHLYNKIISLQKLMEGSQDLKNTFHQQYFATKKMIYNSIEQMYQLNTPAQQTAKEVSFVHYFEEVKRIEVVRAEFHDLILSHMKSQNEEQKRKFLQQAENLIVTFENFSTLTSKERDDFIKMAKATLESLGKLL